MFVGTIPGLGLGRILGGRLFNPLYPNSLNPSWVQDTKVGARERFMQTPCSAQSGVGGVLRSCVLGVRKVPLSSSQPSEQLEGEFEKQQ